MTDGDLTDARRAELAALKAAVYGRDPPPGAIARLAELRGMLDVPATPAVPTAPPVRRPRVRRVLAVACSGLALLVGTALAVRASAGRAPTAGPTASGASPTSQQAVALRDEQAALRQVVFDHPEELSARDWFTVYPEELPRSWRSAGVAAARPGLAGSRILEVPLAPRTTRVLVFLLCGAPDTPFRWTLTSRSGATLAHGAAARCRSLDGRAVRVPPGARSVALRTVITEDVHYSVTVYER